MDAISNKELFSSDRRFSIEEYTSLQGLKLISRAGLPDLISITIGGIFYINLPFRFQSIRITHIKEGIPDKILPFLTVKRLQVYECLTLEGTYYIVGNGLNISIVESWNGKPHYKSLIANYPYSL